MTNLLLFMLVRLKKHQPTLMCTFFSKFVIKRQTSELLVSELHAPANRPEVTASESKRITPDYMLRHCCNVTRSNYSFMLFLLTLMTS